MKFFYNPKRKHVYLKILPHLPWHSISMSSSWFPPKTQHLKKAIWIGNLQNVKVCQLIHPCDRRIGLHRLLTLILMDATFCNKTNTLGEVKKSDIEVVMCTPFPCKTRVPGGGGTHIWKWRTCAYRLSKVGGYRWQICCKIGGHSV